MDASPVAFARVTDVAVAGERLDRALSLYRDETLPLARSFPGYRGVVMLASRSARRVLSMSIWESEHARASAGSDPAMLENVARFGQYFDRAIARDPYTIFLDTWDRSSRQQSEAAFARVTTAQLRPARFDEGMALVCAINSRPAGEPSGYLGAMALGDPHTGKTLVVEVWTTRSALESYEPSVHLHDRVARERQLLATPPVHGPYRPVIVD